MFAPAQNFHLANSTGCTVIGLLGLLGFLLVDGNFRTAVASVACDTDRFRCPDEGNLVRAFPFCVRCLKPGDTIGYEFMLEYYLLFALSV